MRLTLRSLLEHVRKHENWLVAVGFAALFAANSRLLRAVVQNGDTAVYNEQVDAHNFAYRVIHIGYYLIGAVFHALLPFQTDLSMNVMALTFGIGVAFALYASGAFLGSRVAGLCAVAFLFSAHAFVRGALLAEVDILETSAIIMSYALYLRRWNKTSGVMFGVAMLVTPVSAATLPLFLCTFALREGAPWMALRLQVRRLLWFGVCALVVYLPVVVWHRQEYVYGARGLTTAPRMPFDLATQAARSLRFFVDQSRAVALLYLAGGVSAVTDKRLWRLDQPALGVVLSIVATLVVADRTTDVPVQLPNLVALCLLAGLFVARLTTITRFALALPVATLVLMAVPAYAETRAEIERDDADRRLYQSMRAQSQPLELMVVGISGFTPVRVFERYAYRRSYVDRALSVRQFQGRLRALKQAPPTYQIWFLRSVPSATIAALGARFDLVQRRAEGRTLRVLVPLAAEAAGAP